jgi:hypothetical protein
MKKVILVVFLLFLCGGCAARKARVFLPQISSPAAERAGIAFYGTPFQISNGTPFFCSLVAGGKDLGLVGPGGLVFDQRHWHNLWVQYIPVAAVCYRDAELMRYVGAAGRILVLGDNTPAEWTIRSSDIRTPDGRPLSTPTHATTTFRSRRIELPRETLSTVGIQVVNNTTEDAQVFLNGIRRGTLQMGGVYYAPAEVIGNYARPLIITITTGAGCTYTETVWVQKYNQWARQVIFGPEYCGFSQWRWR